MNINNFIYGIRCLRITYAICLISFFLYPLSELLYGQNNELLGSFKIGYLGKDFECAKSKTIFKGINDAAALLEKKYSIEIEAIELTPPNTIENSSQTNAISKAFFESIDGIILNPIESEKKKLIPILELIKINNIQVIFVESQIKSFIPLTYIKPDELNAGKLLAKVIMNNLPTGGRVAILSTNNSLQYEERLQGVKDILGYKRIEKIIYSNPSHLDALTEIQKARSEDRNHYINGWIFLDDWALRGDSSLKLEELKPLVSIQSSAITNHYFELGYLEALVIHPYYDWGLEASKVMIEKIYKNINPNCTLIQLPPILINKNNYDYYKDKWEEWIK